MLTFGTIVLWLHIAAIVAWVGGLFAVSFVFVPVLLKEVHSPKDVARLTALVVHRFQRISWEAISLILLTGILNLVQTGVTRGFNFGTTYVTVLVTKVGLFAAIVAIQAWQSFRLTPALVSIASATQRGTGTAPTETDRLRRRALVTSILNLVLAAAAILLGLELRHG